MRNRSSSCLIALLTTLAFNLLHTAIADDAAILPQGVSRAYWDFYHYLPTSKYR